MRRAARELDWADFNPELFAYTPEYMRMNRQYAHILTATEGQIAGPHIIAKGRRFHIINSYKFAPEMVQEVAESIGCRTEHSAVDVGTWAALILLRSPEAPPAAVSIADAEKTKAGPRHLAGQQR